MRLLGKIDASLAVTRSLWLWFGQVALIVLGTHLAADRIDDALGVLAASVPVPWPDPDMPIVAGQWAGVVLEVAITVWAIRALFRTPENALKKPRDWMARWSVHNVTAPLFWLPVSLAGGWSIAMAIEDALPIHPISTGFAWALAGAVALRLGLSAVWLLIASPPVPRRRSDGVLWLAPLALVAGFATWYGLPIWGWQ